MHFFELLLIAVGLSMDAFAVAICKGLSMKKAGIKNSLIVGLYFGFFQGIMPLIGFFIANQFAEYITSFDHWIAFVLLSIIGGKMAIESFKKEPSEGEPSAGSLQNEQTGILTPKKMLPLSLATSIDALAVGVSFAFLNVQIIPAVSIIGITTLILSMAGVKIGNVFGMKFKSKAELFGGIVLILMGVKILLEHLGVINF